MPFKDGGFTVKEEAIIDAMARTDDVAYAAFKAGTTVATGTVQKAIKRPTVAQAIREKAALDIATVILPLAVARHAKILRDDRAPANAHNKSIDTAYKYGLIPREDAETLDPHAMSPDDLNRAVSAILARERNTVDVTPQRVEEAEPIDDVEGLFD